MLILRLGVGEVTWPSVSKGLVLQATLVKGEKCMTGIITPHTTSRGALCLGKAWPASWRALTASIWCCAWCRPWRCTLQATSLRGCSTPASCSSSRWVSSSSWSCRSLMVWTLASVLPSTVTHILRIGEAK
jgi:hypothetical protein